ncbi:Hemoglobin subunit beta [Oryzias melastigma]|uniref:Hemoglobin subunit beta n=1 Tax=Oryzias melastigma TaxID=30732 RepID=A0A834CEL0_ORYME|nr:Hemoglobin subunit beta [Oryzias melastigma]
MTSLSAKDKAAVKAFWAKASLKAGEVGADALGRILIVHPWRYFGTFGDIFTNVLNYPKVADHGKLLADSVTITIACKFKKALTPQVQANLRGSCLLWWRPKTEKLQFHLALSSPPNGNAQLSSDKRESHHILATEVTRNNLSQNVGIN